MAKFYFNYVYDNHSEVDQKGLEFHHRWDAAREGELMLITVSFEAQIQSKNPPRQLVILEGRDRELVYVKNASDVTDDVV